MASTANTAAPATVASGACWPGTRNMVSAASETHVPKAAAQTPTTSCRLPRCCRLRYSPASRPDAGDRTQAAPATRTAKYGTTAAAGTSPVTQAAASRPQAHVTMS